VAQKKFEKDSKFSNWDLDGDDVVCDDELSASMDLEFRRKELEDADARRDSMRYMAWFCLFGTLNYPAAILITAMLGYDKTASLITEIAPTYFISNSAVLGFYFGANAYSEKKTK
tara:strand:+ start:28 stop:372 length:345 start_codon:yes stop_codon:yes gene_type:complete